MSHFDNNQNLRESIVSCARKMNSSGINQGTSGNISARLNNGMLITPSSVSYSEMEASDILYVDFNGKIIEENRYLNQSTKKLYPSSEWRIHADILNQRKEINAVLHCHAIYSTALSCHQKNIPSFHYMVALAGGSDIRCAKYATFGTERLSSYVIKALEGRLACLLAHHGQISIGKSLSDAFKLAIEIETLAHIYLEACQLGEPVNLSQEEMSIISEKIILKLYLT